MVTFHLLFATLLHHKRLMNRPKFLKDQIWFVIKIAFQVSPIAISYLLPIFWLEVRGYAKLYDTVADSPGWWCNILQIPLFLIFTDFFAYWLHRFGHIRQIDSIVLYIYNLFHSRVHHSFIKSTSNASFGIYTSDILEPAFPIFVVPFILPLQKIVYILLIAAFNLLTICNHDGKFLSNILMSSASRSLHDKYRNCNFGTIFTILDRLHGTYRKPENLIFRDGRWLNATEWTNEPSNSEKKHE